MKTTIWVDPIVEEVRAVREELARESGYDVRKLAARLQESQIRHGAKLVSRTPRKIELQEGLVRERSTDYDQR